MEDAPSTPSNLLHRNMSINETEGTDAPVSAEPEPKAAPKVQSPDAAAMDHESRVGGAREVSLSGTMTAKATTGPSADRARSEGVRQQHNAQR